MKKIIIIGILVMLCLASVTIAYDTTNNNFSVIPTHDPQQMCLSNPCGPGFICAPNLMILFMKVNQYCAPHTNYQREIHLPDPAPYDE